MSIRIGSTRIGSTRIGSTQIGIAHLAPSYDYVLWTAEAADNLAEEVYWFRPLKVFTRDINHPALQALCRAWLRRDPETLPATIWCLDQLGEWELMDEDALKTAFGAVREDAFESPGAVVEHVWDGRQFVRQDTEERGQNAIG